MSVLQYVRESLLEESKALAQLSAGVGDDYELAIDLLMNCKGKVVVCGIGKSGHIGKKIAASLSSTGTPSFFVHAAEAVHGDSGMIEPRDVVILLSNSGETAEVLNMLEIVEKIGASRIAITRERSSTLAKHCDVALTYKYEKDVDHLGLAPTTSALLQLAIGDALAVVTSRLKQFAKEDFHMYHPGGSLGKQLKKDINQTG
jgi:arabinose-5-phosphate isomerase